MDYINFYGACYLSCYGILTNRFDTGVALAITEHMIWDNILVYNDTLATQGLHARTHARTRTHAGYNCLHCSFFSAKIFNI